MKRVAFLLALLVVVMSSVLWAQGTALWNSPRFQQIVSRFFAGEVISTELEGSFAAAIAKAGTNTRTIRTSTSQTVTAGLTVPRNVTLEFTGAGLLTCTGSPTININGPLSALPQQIFDPTCTIRFGTGSEPAWPGLALYTEWFGSIANDTLDDSAGIQRTFDSLPFQGAELGRGGHVKCLLGVYTINAQVLIKNKAGITYEGVNRHSCIWRPGTGFASSAVLKIADARAVRIAHLHIEGNGTTAPQAAIELRQEATVIISSSQNLIEHVTLGSASANSLQYGIRMTADVDANNEKHVLRDVRVMNCSQVAISIEHANSLDHKISNLSVDTCANGIRTAGGSYTCVACDFGTIATRIFDFAAGTYYYPSFIYGGTAEGGTAMLLNSVAVDNDILISGFFNKTTPSSADFIIYSGGSSGSERGALTLQNVTTAFSGAKNMTFSSSGNTVYLFGNTLSVGTLTYAAKVVAVGNRWIQNGAGYTAVRQAGGNLMSFGDYQGKRTNTITAGRQASGTLTFGAADTVLTQTLDVSGNLDGYKILQSARIPFGGGTPGQAALHAWVSSSTDASFTITLEAAPGAGNQVAVDWMLVYLQP